MITTILSKTEVLYDVYSPMLFGIALQISPTIQKAEHILAATFCKAHEQNISDKKHPILFLGLIRLLVEIAHQEFNNGKGCTNFNVVQFQKSSIVHSILFELIPLENYCLENNLNRQEAMRNMRSEFLEIMRTHKFSDTSISSR